MTKQRTIHDLPKVDFDEWSWSKKQGNIYKDIFVKVVWFHAGFKLEGSKFEWNFEEGEIIGNVYQNPELRV